MKMFGFDDDDDDDWDDYEPTLGMVFGEERLTKEELIDAYRLSQTAGTMNSIKEMSDLQDQGLSHGIDLSEICKK